MAIDPQNIEHSTLQEFVLTAESIGTLEENSTLNPFDLNNERNQAVIATGSRIGIEGNNITTTVNKKDKEFQKKQAISRAVQQMNLVQSIENELSRLTDSLFDLQEERYELNIKLDQVNNDIAELETEEATAQTKVAEKEEQLQKQEQTSEALEKEVQQAKEDVEAAEQKNEEAQDNAAEGRKQDDQNGQCSLGTAKAEDHANETKTDLAEKKRHLDEVTNRLEASKLRENTFQDQIDNAKERLEGIQGKLEELRAEKNELEAQDRVLVNKIDTLKDKIEALEIQEARLTADDGIIKKLETVQTTFSNKMNEDKDFAASVEKGDVTLADYTHSVAPEEEGILHDLFDEIGDAWDGLFDSDEEPSQPTLIATTAAAEDGMGITATLNLTEAMTQATTADVTADVEPLPQQAPVEYNNSQYGLG